VLVIILWLEQIFQANANPAALPAITVALAALLTSNL